MLTYQEFWVESLQVLWTIHLAPNLSALGQ